MFLSTDCLPVVMGERLEEFGLTQPKEWHGAPLASLRRAFTALACSKIYVVGDETVANLRTLFDLYFKPTLANRSILGTRVAKHLRPRDGSRRPSNQATQTRYTKRGDAEEGNCKTAAI
ncbi:hypothetical protein N7519_007230 [Penicillium mononematosum]|uniref:uncharacterized protein n=1 Tax=Penicillium mononematosum TaxID=268346 RepID=UPI00254728F5|nr:uncharacterized protein N7519_007230 [Penicillium mononematosum]KAJ6185929.1 hypothetical protein N7519_007230 [Penicillium mononematosum]